MYGKGLRTLSIASAASLGTALGLVFFYAPLDADQGFIQKIFYIHVPLAIVTLFGFIAGGLMAIKYLRSGDRKKINDGYQRSKYGAVFHACTGPKLNRF